MRHVLRHEAMMREQCAARSPCGCFQRMASGSHVPLLPAAYLNFLDAIVLGQLPGLL